MTVRIVARSLRLAGFVLCSLPLQLRRRGFQTSPLSLMSASPRYLEMSRLLRLGCLGIVG